MQAGPARRIAIGDIHGCVHALTAILDAIQPAPKDEIICLGDVIDTGRESKEVVDRLIQLSSECSLILIQGNHEEMMLSALDDPGLRDSWLNCGGFATVNSYKFCGDIDAIETEHIQFLKTARDYYETDEHIFVHANYESQLSMAELAPYTLRWSLVEEEEPSRHFSGKTVVVGHTEQRDGEILDLGCLVCIDTYCHGYGWLTAVDVKSGQFWQASRWGALRETGESVDALKSIKPRLKGISRP